MGATTSIGTVESGGAADIEVTGLTKRYGDDPSAVAAVDGLDLRIASGEFVAVVGASGCGKSTLMRVLAGFESVTAGQVLVAGRPVRRPGPDRGVVFQDYGLFPWLTVRENVMYGPRRAGRSRAQARAVADEMIETVGLSRVADRFPGQLSGGMQQRVAIGRVLANRPSVLLMDEPFGALDALTRTTMQQELSRIHGELGTTVLFITHSIEEAVYLADRVVVMTAGASHGVPGHVAAVLQVDLDRPRDSTSAPFNDLERRVSDLVHLPLATP